MCTPLGQGAMLIVRVLIKFHDIIGQMLCHRKMFGLIKFHILYVADNLWAPNIVKEKNGRVFRF